ncbi:DNA-directed RNA polymerase III subunit RPC4 [Pantherophis guttatus]|uniref:DNA-directed RNA polymerase III subunit RPC4 n=1 Tax=Pantherophis guttatus TaxID=94885 RepID=A0A6P9D9C4_PANGU|nr:DNA-directed RNA polymerase III subunit RPC4 [Pantherophis guttatus]XP_034288816.1 DNA-directed RNA polymerase III subunit RPC4 [Pantherophis guttatus]XP_034288817.1 DNA-directed RNA polymerase III subunit RPC4 [Pantherophis guttatus]
MSEGTSSGDPESGRPSLPPARGLIGRRTPAPISAGRLPSIRSRDLTLGGVKKKTFAPNIISRKIKEEPKEDLSALKEKKDRDRDRQRESHGRGRGRPEVIQSHSIFEQGPAEMMRKKGTWDKSVDMSDFGPSHIINIKKEKRETDEETKKILRMLEKDDFLDDPGLKNDIRNKPVQLPLAHSGWLFKEEGDDQEDGKLLNASHKEEELETGGSSSVKVKEEPHDEEETPCAQAPAPTKNPPPFPHDVSLAELLPKLSLSKEEELLFLQLPDTLPGQPPTQDTKPLKTEVQNEDGQMMVIKQEKTQETKEAENTCTLGDLSEGQVGKLLIRKSGKVQLVLGQVTLDITTGTPCSFLQELVSVSIGDNRSGEMIVLGHVKHKLVCAPDFESLLAYKHR